MGKTSESMRLSWLHVTGVRSSSARKVAGVVMNSILRSVATTIERRWSVELSHPWFWTSVLGKVSVFAKCEANEVVAAVGVVSKRGTKTVLGRRCSWVSVAGHCA
jgi:hypothetical protein